MTYESLAEPKRKIATNKEPKISLTLQLRLNPIFLEKVVTRFKIL